VRICAPVLSAHSKIDLAVD
jgi:hypothetical protein